MTRRIADCLITHEALYSLLGGMDGHTAFRLEGLPAEPTLVAVRDDWERSCLALRIASPELEEVEEGDRFPALPLRVVRAAGRPSARDAETVRDVAEVIQQIRERVTEATRDTDHFEPLPGATVMAALWDARFLLRELDRVIVEREAARAEAERLRLIFGDYRQDAENGPARLAYEQGWCEGQAQARLDTSDRRRMRESYRSLGLMSERAIAEGVGLDLEVEAAALAAEGAPYPDVSPPVTLGEGGPNVENVREEGNADG